MRTFITLLLAFLAIAAPAQILTTEVWVGNLAVKDGQFVVSDLVNVSNGHPGYDNQPAFFPDNETLVYTTQATTLEDSGLGVHAVLWKNGTATPLVDAKGFSPTPTADGKQLMMLRQGRVWLHDLSGKELKGLTETSEAGYYARFDDRNWVLFMNDKDRRIVIHDVKTKALDTMATNTSTAPYRIPGKKQAVTFVGEGKTLNRLDVKERKVTKLATIPFPTGGHHVWMLDNKGRATLLMASGPTVYEWNPAKPDDWNVVWKSFHPDLQGITRIALSPKGDRIAFVSTPSDATIIRDSRAASNRLIAAHNAEGVAAIYHRDAIAITSSGGRLTGREEIGKAYAEQFAQREGLVYVRTPDAIDVSKSGDIASERGTWTGKWKDVDIRGHYMAVWRRDVGENGVPSWTIRSEQYVALACDGGGC